MEAPAGYGTENFFADTSLLPYQIDFENAPTATAPAQRVDITDQLNPNLDWSSFQLVAVGFGSTYISIPAGLQHYDTTVNMTENGQNFNVLISLNLNPATGVFTASFQSIDPDTKLPPVSLLTGFLPPEDGSGNGSGFVSFTVSPKVSLPTGTQITNVADISFDLGKAIATDQVSETDPSQGVNPTKQALVTIDSGSPTSSVAALPARTATLNFTVNWAGQDDAGGSGIASYNVYYSDNGGTFLPFLTGTTQTSATFNGVSGHTYGFFSVATDNVGNQQVLPTGAQTSTLVIQTITTLTDNGPNPSATGQVVSFTATVTGSPLNNGETVSLEDASNSNAIVGTGPLTNGTATIVVSNLSVGSHNLFAVYAGDTNLVASQSSQVTQLVEPFVVAINRIGSSPTNAASVQFSVFFSSSVSGLTAANFSLVATGTLSNAAISQIDGRGNNYVVTVGFLHGQRHLRGST